MLSPQEMVTQKSHIAGCARCQEILATLELTEAIPISERDSREVVASAKRGSVTAMPKRKMYLRWAVPAGAIAAGILVLVAVRTRQPELRSSDAAVQVAENRESAKEESYPAKTLPSVAAPAPVVADKNAGKTQEEEKQELDAFTSGHRAKDLTRGRTGSGAGFGRGPALTQNQMQNQIQNNGQIAAQNQASAAFDDKADKKMNELPLPARNADAGAVADNEPRRSESAMKAKAAPGAPSPAPSPPAPSEQAYEAGAAAAATRAAKPSDADARKDEAVKSMTQSVEGAAFAAGGVGRGRRPGRPARNRLSAAGGADPGGSGDAGRGRTSGRHRPVRRGTSRPGRDGAPSAN
jgi:hypothetical protein